MFAFHHPFTLAYRFALAFPLLGEDEGLPLPFDLPFELLTFEVAVYVAWYGPVRAILS